MRTIRPHSQPLGLNLPAAVVVVPPEPGKVETTRRSRSLASLGRFCSLLILFAGYLVVAPANAGAPIPKIANIAQPYTHTQRYTLDANGNRTTVTDAANTTTQQSFDAQNRLTVSTTPGEGSTRNTWNKDGTLASIEQSFAPAVIPANAGTQLKTAARSATPSAQPTTNTTRYTYDRAKRITEITHTQNGATTLGFTYQYDQNGNRTSETRTQSAINGQAGSIQTTTYAYDRDDRLIQTTVTHQPPDPVTPDERTDWTLDAVGNRLIEVVTRITDNTPTSNKNYVYNERDQLTLMTDSVNQLSVEYAYDQNGNRTSRTVTKQGQPAETIQYTFDARDRLIQAQPNAPNPQNIPTVAYRYDPDGRRIERIETPVGATPVVATLYLYNGSTLQHEATPDATANTANATGLRLTDTYRASAKLDRHIGFDLAGTPTVRLYQLDALDSPVALTDASGNTVTRTTYNAWGEIEQQVANGVVQTPWQLPNYNPDQTGQAALLSNDGQILGFIGFQKDSATGLYYAQARWYDPLVGGFNAMDPAFGRTESPLSFNSYLYANANPARFVDLDGRRPCEGVQCGLVLAGGLANTQALQIRIGELQRTNNEQNIGSAEGVAEFTVDTVVSTATLLRDVALAINEMGTGNIVNSPGLQTLEARATNLVHFLANHPIDAVRAATADQLAKADALAAGGDIRGAAKASTKLLLNFESAALGGVAAVRAGAAGLSRLSARSAPEIGLRDIDLDFGGGIDRSGLPPLIRRADAVPAPPNAMGGGAGAALGWRAAELPEGGVGVTRSGVRANKAAGDEFEGVIGAELLATHEIVVPQVTIKTPSGVRTRVDFVTSDGTQIGCVECKASATAPLTRNQAAAFPEIQRSGGVVVGKGKPGAPGGTVIPPGTQVTIRRPCGSASCD